MEEELKRFIQVMFSTIITVSYCYYLPPKIKAGVPRLLSILPVCVQFFVFPMLFSSSFLIRSMFYVMAMGSVRLILFAFDKGPLFPLPPNLLHFICFTCLPIKKRQQNPKSQPSSRKWVFAIEVAMYGALLHARRHYKQNVPWILHPVNMYLSIDIVLTPLILLLTIILGCDLEPVFDEPYLATSLQDFWGRRWNRMVSSILRSGVYAPIKDVSKGNSGLTKFLGVFTTFLVSGLAHELLYFYQTRVMPSGEITLFYVLNGVCTAAEMAVKRTKFGRRLAVKPAVSWLLTMTFLFVTSGWLYYPQINRGNTRQ